MADYIVDPDRFLLAAALVDYMALARRDEQHLAAVLRRDQRARKLVQLRWMMSPALGYPTGPFEVWRRPALNVQLEKPLPLQGTGTALHTLFGWQAWVTPGPMLYVRADVTANHATQVMAFAGAPFGSALVGVVAIQAGRQNVSFSGAQVSTLVLFDGTQMNGWVGIDPQSANAGQWELVERVGLPVDPDDWSGVFALADKQGMPAAPVPPIAAALDRFARGAAPFGWPTQLAPGRAAPAWRQADPDAFLKMFSGDVLGLLKDMVTSRAPQDHRGFTMPVSLPLGNGEFASGSFCVLPVLLFAAATDPVASLLTGFGTALEEIDFPPISVRDRPQFDDPDRSDSDFRVTATYARGLDGQSGEMGYAAIALSPRRALPPPAPAQLHGLVEGLAAPGVTDGPWRALVQLAWDRLPPGLPLRSASYAHARALASGGAATCLLQLRKHDTAHQPIGVVGASPLVPDPGITRASDDDFRVPGQPATTALLYGAAHQDIFGLWSTWSTAGLTVGEPPVQTVAILALALEATAGTGTSAGTLVVDFAWDWRLRSPAAVRLAFALFPQAVRNAPAPAGFPTPTGAQFALGAAAGGPIEVSFGADGSTGAPPSVTVTHLSEDGRDVVAQPLANAGPRRYRARITGFALDFGASPHIGVALSVHGVERRAPGRVGDWGTMRFASASDPRPPVVLVEHEDVLLASLPDANGINHAQLAWPAAPGATGYFLYAAQESKFLADCGKPQAKPETRLSDRLRTLRDLFGAQGTKRMFTRLNDTAVAGTTFPVTLPKGTSEIHLFVVIGISAGGIESAWPDASDPLKRKRPIAYAAPRRLVPATPTLEVRTGALAGPGPFAVNLAVTTPPGIAATRVELHRVRNEAALADVDTMGPPVLAVQPGDPRWKMTPPNAAAPVQGEAGARIVASDSPPGAWRPVWYRAVAWSAPRPDRGILGGRSQPSAARSVLVPPAGPPDLAPLLPSWPVPGGNVVEIATTTSAPVNATPLGPHRLRVEIFGVQGDGSLESLFAWPAHEDDKPPPDNALALVPTALAPGGSAIMREAVPGGTRVRLHVVRPDVQTPLRVRMQLDDPLGRMTERTLEVAAGAPLPALQFAPINLRRRIPHGFVASTRINLPLVIPVGVGLRIKACFRRGIARVFPPRPIGAAVTVDLDYLAIPPLAPGENPFLGPQAIAVRRDTVDAASTSLRFWLRGNSGVLTVTAVAADGSSVSVSRMVI